jgi:hypothetical protein
VTVRVEECGHPSLPLLRVTTPDLALVFAPTRGGRLLSLVADGGELLWTDPTLLDDALAPAVPLVSWPTGEGGMSTWANVGGSKTWPAPQGWSGPDDWAGPPDPVLDSGAWTASWSMDGDGAVVTLVSPDDERSGLRITRCFSMPAAGTAFTQRVTFANISDRERRWAIWEVCQVDTAAGAGLGSAAAVVIPHATTPVELDLGSYEGRVESTLAGDDVVLPVGTGVAKRGYPGASGSVRYRDPSGRVLELATTPAATGEWPDGGSRVEVWLQRLTAAPIAALEGLHPSSHLVELEVLGPLVTLAPGMTTQLDITWRVGSPGGR